MGWELQISHNSPVSLWDAQKKLIADFTDYADSKNSLFGFFTPTRANEYMALRMSPKSAYTTAPASLKFQPCSSRI